MARPIIGITPGYDEKGEKIFVKDGYYNGIIKAGGLPSILPLTDEEAVLEEFFGICGGFLLCGGPDMDARRFGEENLPCNGEISPLRDSMEIYIAKRAIELGKPVFGICRGIQVMNVALGGTLYQDISSQNRDRRVLKHSQDAPKWYPTHEIFIEEGTKVWRAFMKEKADVNSFHHQAVKDVASGFRVTSRTSDGMVESIEYEGHPFAVGVQWHPEVMWEKNDLHLELFREFVRQASETG
ncbi:peptidase C26 [Clostridium thermosuccinogenes]|uniref:Peptidase C26 n=1 Tax=Clostridium thermosuccinogenes TaxID=84032 RepID=A0A2K2F9M5_9CLOT|nr:gamma-glutamyl-gamma-aminobutyrate hydrolase family protein [Pseudoclostridium thermosuccinogenes]AUS98301.1 peptidase C26 [Pseudoclostridium thermosuccinogenes]PNT94821.1 peptidase C26 [Pseudoclostridium thermosuccinogenes]PNT95464.1 peptidase C26 [Pseudoclostridium thermosuccinogenes]